MALLLTAGSVFADVQACQRVGEGAGSAAPSAFAEAVGRGPLYAGLISWLSGLGVSLTPCVYPMIAVTVSVFGARQSKSRWEGVGLSSAFVLGLVAMFVPLGVIMGLTGQMMGSLLQAPWVVVGISLLFLTMAASMFGAFDMELPSSIQNRLSGLGGVGYKGAFLLGLVSGIVAAPCTGPFLTGMLAWIAQTQSAVSGALAMAAFALGLGCPFFLVGAFAVQLPKSGKWMVQVKYGLGVVLAVAALYFLGSKFPVLAELARPERWFLGLAAAAGTAGVLGLLRASRWRGAAQVTGKIAGATLASLGFYLALASLLRPSGSLEWQPLTLEAARSLAKTEGKPVLADFTASWCVACRELEKYTFSDAAVGSEAGRFVAVKTDLSEADDPAAEKTKREQRILGLPTVLVFNSRGEEALRCTDFVKPGEFLEHLKTVH